MNQFQTTPSPRYFLQLPSSFLEKKESEWLHALCLNLRDHGTLQVSHSNEAQWSDLSDLMIDQSANEFLMRNQKMIVLVPHNYSVCNLGWFQPQIHRVILYGTIPEPRTDGLIFSICSGVLWMNNIPTSLAKKGVVFAATTRAKSKWAKFSLHDWWGSHPIKASEELSDLLAKMNTQISHLKDTQSQQIELLHTTYREEIKAWSKITQEKKSKSEQNPMPIVEDLPVESFNKQLHAQQTYIKDLETRLSRYENQIMSILWHQCKQLISIFFWRLPLAICLLGYHIFSIFYHRYKTSK